MLKSSFSRLLHSVVELSPAEDRTLRCAFGRFAQSKFRKNGEAIVSDYGEKERWFHCDCRPNTSPAPLLFPVLGKFIRRQIDGKGTPHDERCEFARDPEEQNGLINSYRQLMTEDKNQFSLLRNFSKDHEKTETSTANITTNRSRPRLARVLCTLLRHARLDRFFPGTPLSGNRDQQISDIEEAAGFYFLAPNRKVSDWLAPSLKEYYGLKQKLERKPEGWKRPHGIFIDTFDRIENNTLYPNRADRKPLHVTGKLALFGEGTVAHRPPYLVIGLLSQLSADADHVELLRAYAHPCVAWDRLTLVDSQLERETLKLLIKCRDWLAKNENIKLSIEKPLFDVGPPMTDDARELCLPDFILRREGQTVAVIETMGYDDAIYRQRKLRMRSLFERIGKGPYPVPLIEHDRLIKGMKDCEVDKEFCRSVCKVISGNAPNDL